MRIYIYIRIHVYKYTHTYSRSIEALTVPENISAYVYKSVYTFLGLVFNIDVYIYAYIYIHIYIYIYICMYVYVYCIQRWLKTRRVCPLCNKSAQISSIHTKT
jgi:cytochrome P450 family 4